MRKVRVDKVRKAIQKSKIERVRKEALEKIKKRADVPSNPYCEYPCQSCGESRNGYENHHCRPECAGCCGSRVNRRGDFCESCAKEPAEDHK